MDSETYLMGKYSCFLKEISVSGTLGDFIRFSGAMYLLYTL